ncbi:tRNA (adenosine(37)-N6)-threonylcarbamoyltransferase complex ATPase subunit type 1 TsaE [Patescibacteria group bacterium]|nr:tRNA (adenosine(37)-N6)-threonylcarbamoyltransferase complex ATPase subunit type 1 TsaE [Patescibacteria group bacterium]
MLKFDHNYSINRLADTKAIAKELVQHILGNKNQGHTIGLIGDLGAGKTTFVKSIAKCLGIKNNITSPTFVIMKVYDTPKNNINPTKINQFVHIDAYRLSTNNYLNSLGANEYIKDQNTLTIIEWADKVADNLPKNTIFAHMSSNNERTIIFSLDHKISKT